MTNPALRLRIKEPPGSRTARTILIGCALILTACGKTGEDHAHDHHDHDPAAEDPAVLFREGTGLLLAPETAAALGLETRVIEERRLEPIFEITAAVFDAGPPARASAFVPAEMADALGPQPANAAQVLAIRRDVANALNQVEVVLALPGTPAVGATVHLNLRGTERTTLAVPASAVLRSASGTFVYVVNGAALLRTPVHLGVSDGAYHEIVDGLYEGDVVATSAVEQLWLTELRLTKGGGHAH